MKRNARSANTLSAVLIAIVLVACSISGLAAGVYARHLGDRLASATATAPASAASHTPHLHATATAIIAPIPTTTPTVQHTETAPFILKASAVPSSLTSGQSFTITVLATSQHGAAPVPGLTCYMRAPSDGRAPLFQTWPPQAITDANGQATWNLAAPQVASGPYGVEVVAYGANGYNYYSDTFVTITG